MKPRFSVIILSAGKGTRMGTDIPKQYIEIDKKPLIVYSVEAFMQCGFDDIILVVDKNDLEYVKKDIVERHQLRVTQIVPGGKERFHSVQHGLSVIENSDYVFIHDGARPCVSKENIDNLKEAVVQTPACVLAVPTKDTIKIINQKKEIIETPDRSLLWKDRKSVV